MNENEDQKVKIRSFTDLIAWKEGHKLVLAIYGITEKFPNKEQFGLTSQMRRGVISITSNIAEGFSRNTDKDKSHFYSMAQGSLTELQSQLLTARDVKYISSTDCGEIAKQTILVHKLLHGLKRIGNNTKY